jgi:uncharacterized membrane protein
MKLAKGSQPASIFTKNRLEALADGVFAIAMTLLVLELSVPLITGTSANAELTQRLLEMWPKFLAYVVSFLVLGVIWINHHLMFHHIKRSDSRLVWINILMLMFVALVPFSTSLLGEYMQTQAAIVAYGANILLCLVMGFALWTYATGRYRLVDSDIDPKLVRRTKFMFLVAALLFLLAMGVSFISPVASFGIYALMALVSIISTWLGEQGFLSKALVRMGEKRTSRGGRKA